MWLELCGHSPLSRSYILYCTLPVLAYKLYAYKFEPIDKLATSTDYKLSL